jgi:hypothetical protein
LYHGFYVRAFAFYAGLEATDSKELPVVNQAVVMANFPPDPATDPVQNSLWQPWPPSSSRRKKTPDTKTPKF